jgi:hypothetical protein
VNLDAGPGKTQKMPLGKRVGERQALQFRSEVFNVTNTQRFNNATTARDGVVADPKLNNALPPPSLPTAKAGPERAIRPYSPLVLSNLRISTIHRLLLQ